MLNSVEILYNKTLYHQAFEVLKKAKKIAFRFEILGLQQKILDWEMQLFPTQKKTYATPSAMEQLYTDYKKVAQQIKAQNTYKVLHTKAQLIYDSVSDGIYSKEKIQEFEALMNHPFIKKEKRAITFLSKVLHHEVHFLNAQVHPNNQDALKWGAMLFNIWTNAPEQKEIYRTIFLKQLKGYTFYKIEFDIDRNFTAILAEWKSIIPLSNAENILLKNEIETIHSKIQSNNVSFSTNTLPKGKYKFLTFATSTNY